MHKELSAQPQSREWESGGLGVGIRQEVAGSCQKSAKSCVPPPRFTPPSGGKEAGERLALPEMCTKEI